MIVDGPNIIIITLKTYVYSFKCWHIFLNNPYFINGANFIEGSDNGVNEKDDNKQSDELPVGQSQKLQKISIVELCHNLSNK